MAVTIKHFVDRWSKEMGRAERYGRESHWEAEEAIKELGEKFPHWLRTRSLRREILKDLLREAQAYEYLRDQVAESNRAFRSALSLVATLRRKTSRKAAAMRQKSGPACELISRYLVDVTTQMERCSKELEEARSNFWRIRLSPYPLKRDNSQEVWIALPTSSEEWDSPRDVFYEGKVAEGVMRTAKLSDPKPDPKRTIDLDQRFQLRVATIIDQRFPNLSMETRARLVVLIYICFGLVSVSDGEIRIRSNSEELTAGAVYEKLKRQKRRQRIKS
ncbi:MAG: hypothetical protein WAN09_14545 [Candidatus Korobacteraceae bacterium]